MVLLDNNSCDTASQVVIQCCCQLVDALRLCQDNTLLHLLVTKLKDPADLLSQSVAVGMLEDLALTHYGYDWLLGHDVMADLTAMLDDDGNPLAALIQPGTLYSVSVTLSVPVWRFRLGAIEICITPILYYVGI